MEIPEIDVVSFAALHEAGAVVIDVRNPHEYEAGHVPGARLIPMAELPERVSEIPRDQPVYVVCATGARSGRAAHFFKEQGIDATNIAGGTKAWMQAGHPTTGGNQP